MPNMVDDGFIDRAFDAHLFSSFPTNLDYLFQNAVSNAITVACASGLFTCNVDVSSYTAANANDATQKNNLINIMIQRLVNMGYNTPTLSGTTLTLTW